MFEVESCIRGSHVYGAVSRSAATERLLPHEGDSLSAGLVLFVRLAVRAALYV